MLDQEILADVQSIIDDQKADSRLRSLARAVMMLANRSLQGKENTLEAFDQIRELGKRQDQENQPCDEP